MTASSGTFLTVCLRLRFDERSRYRQYRLFVSRVYHDGAGMIKRAEADKYKTVCDDMLCRLDIDNTKPARIQTGNEEQQNIGQNKSQKEHPTAPRIAWGCNG